MYQFFVDNDQISEGEILIFGTDVNHIKNVLRMKSGDLLRISGKMGGDFYCRIIELREDRICTQIQEKADSNELSSKIYLFQGIPKGDRMENVIEKAVELGVHEIIPVAMKRCVVRLDENKAAAKVKKWQQLCETSAKQSKRDKIPQIHDVLGFKEALQYAGMTDLRIFPYEGAKGMEETQKLLSDIVPGCSISVMIGPEGGFAPEEVELAAKEMQIISLGKRILRTDTAGITIMSALMLALEMA